MPFETTEITPGKWYAYVIHEGYALDDVEIAEADEDTLGDVFIRIVRDSAAPVIEADLDGDHLRFPGSHYSDDLAFEWADFDSRAQFEMRWTRAKAMTAGLNAEATP